MAIHQDNLRGAHSCSQGFPAGDAGNAVPSLANSIGGSPLRCHRECEIRCRPSGRCSTSRVTKKPRDRCMTLVASPSSCSVMESIGLGFPAARMRRRNTLLFSYVKASFTSAPAQTALLEDTRSNLYIRWCWKSTPPECLL